jgi:AraC-like DNA-binding protein
MLDQIAREAFLSKFYFIRLFKSLYGCSPCRYLTAVRIENAKRLLKDGFPLTDVCASVGFESVTSFITLFKKMTGSTPVDYQKKKSNSR